MKNFLKGKIKNKFIAVVVGVISLILCVQWYISVSLLGIDTSSYVLLIEGEGLLNNSSLVLNTKKKLSVDDKVETLGGNSVAVVEWGDGSLTRLGANSRVVVHELDVEKDLSKINVSFTLESGKSWSNVVSFLGKESYFKQNFEDIEASVRGTVFDVDLTQDYIHVVDHEVKLKKGEDEILVKENTAVRIKTFSFIDLQNFLNSIRDKAWEEYNTKLDVEYLKKLKSVLLEKFSKKNINMLISETLNQKSGDLVELEKNISEFSDEKKEETYSILLEQYQKLNFIKSNDKELFETKNTIKKLLIATAGEEDKKNLLKYSLYDLKDAIDFNDFDAVKSSFSIISDNLDTLEKFDLEIFSDIEIIPNGLKEIFGKNTDIVKSIFGENISKFGFDDLDIDFAKGIVDSSTKKATKSFDTIKGQIDGFLNNPGE